MKLNKKSIGIIFVLLTVSIAGWFLANKQFQNKTNLTQNSVETGNDNQKQNKNPTDQVIEELVMNKKWIKDAPQLKQEFENFIKEHGTKIELEKVDTTNWKTYKDEKRGFEFKYPNDWYVIPIDSTWSLTDSYSKKGQRRESRIIRTLHCDESFTDASMIKGCTQPYPFLCLADQSTYESIPQRFKDKNGIESVYPTEEYCDIVLEEAFPRLKSSDKSAGRMWLESYKAYSDFKHLKYVVNKNILLSSGSNPTFTFRFLNNRGGFIEIRDTDPYHKTPIIISTVRYIN